MQIDVAVRFSSVKEVHRGTILWILQQWDLFQLECEVLWLGKLNKDLNNEVLVIEERHVVQASVIV